MRGTRQGWRTRVWRAAAGLTVGLGLLGTGCEPTAPVGQTEVATAVPTDETAAPGGDAPPAGRVVTVADGEAWEDAPVFADPRGRDDVSDFGTVAGTTAPPADRPVGPSSRTTFTSSAPAPATPRRPMASPEAASPSGGFGGGAASSLDASGLGAYGGEARRAVRAAGTRGPETAPAGPPVDLLMEAEAVTKAAKGDRSRASADEEAGGIDAPAETTAAAPGEGRSSGFDRRLQSGTLTAGSLDDHRGLDDFATFVAKVQEHDRSELMPRFAIGQRHSIIVLGRDDQPLGDVRIEVLAPGDGVRHAATTGTDGRTLFLTGRDGTGTSEKYRVRATIPGRSEPIVETFSASQSPWVVRADDVAAAKPKRLDLALVIDCTGSMADELEYLKVEIASIAGEIRAMFPDVEQRFALVTYRDHGDEYVTRAFDFTTDLDAFRADLGTQSAGGGGDTPEAMDEALVKANELDWSAKETAKVCFLVADAPPHDDRMAGTLGTIGDLRAKTVRLYPLMGSGSDEKAEFLMRAGAFLTRGRYLFLTDHSGVGGGHADPHAKKFEVERLDRLMVRLIAGELAGRQLQADHIVAIEEGTDPAEFVVTIEPESTTPQAPTDPNAARAVEEDAPEGGPAPPVEATPEGDAAPAVEAPAEPASDGPAEDPAEDPAPDAAAVPAEAASPEDETTRSSDAAAP